jgi:quinoprotein glucose dehydrogenase
MSIRGVTAVIAALVAPALAQGATGEATGWAYNGGPNADHYSPLTQITPGNVTTLREVWRLPMDSGGLESQPMMIGRTLYVITTARKLVALDAATGQTKWTFDPPITGSQPIRGLASWMDGKKLRILFGREHMLFMVDAETGQPTPGFGDGGHIDLRENLRGKAEDNHVYLTSPVMVYRNLIVVGSRVAENTPASPGDVRAFDARTGKHVWTFHTIPHPGEVGADSWPKDAHLTQGGANAWSGASVDVARGIVFVNTGSAADDLYGGERLGANRFANSTIALDAMTGKRLWDFQQVHHDLWDSDSTSPPLLTSIMRNGRKVDVAVATNKQSYLYVFDRKTGKPVFPIVEQPFPGSTVPGEVASKTQPIPTLPRPLSRKSITIDDLTTASPEANAAAREIYAKLNGAGGPYVPLALDKDTLIVPGFSGGNEWGGMAADRDGVIYANVSNGASISRLVDNSEARAKAGAPGSKPPPGGLQNGYALLRYAFSGYGRFLTPDGQPAVSPPAATLNAVDLNSGQYRWSIPLPAGYSGAGPVVTATGLLFISSAGNLQAYSTKDGTLLWEQKLPALTGNTTAIYQVDGKEYVVLASGGRGTPAYIAYALPN